MNKFKEKILVKKEKLIISYLWIIISIFGIFFYTFIIVDGSGFLLSIIILIMGISLRILLLKGKLSYLKNGDDKDFYIIISILYYTIVVFYLLKFIVNPYENALWLLFGLAWSVSAVYYTLLYAKLFKMKIKKRNKLN